MGRKVFNRDEMRVLETLRTQRLFLLALKPHQLELYLDNPSALENELQLTVSRDILTEPVRRALGLKIQKLQNIHFMEQPWYTYWLIVPKKDPFGAGLAGFKGVPNTSGSTEIGYGIDPAYQNKGYMSEAVKALVDWAFQHPSCNVITATAVENPASRRLLEKLGARLVAENETSSSWEFTR